MELIQAIESDRQFLPKEGPLCIGAIIRGSAQKEGI
jgi:hypothetical protein